MKRILLLTTAIAFGTAAYAQQGNPGAHFLEKWDSDEDGQVTLVEVIERRGDIFTTFDEGDDGFLSAKDYIMFDEARANDQAAMKAAGQGQGKGQGGEGQAMTMEFNDVNNDGQVSRD